MFYNGDNRYPVNQFLGEVHERLRKKYALGRKVGKDAAEAETLTIFFQKIKNQFLNNQQDLDETDEQFFNEIQKIVETKMGKTIFNYKGMNSTLKGNKFEEDIANIVSAIATGTTKDASDIQTGTEKAYGSKSMQRFLKDNTYVISYQSEKGQSYNIELLTKDLNNGVKEWIIQEALPKSIQKVKEKNQNQNKYNLYMTQINAKTDINNMNTVFTKEWNFSPETQKAVNILKTATFTAKNYNAGSNLHLGDTNPVRTYFSVLDSLKYNYKTESSSFLHGINLFHSKNVTQDRKTVYSQHIYKLRFIYELIGAGLKGQDLTELASAKFLLYNVTNNDNIYVRSTKQIIATLYDNFDKDFTQKREDPFSGGMYLRLPWIGLESNYKE